MACMSYSTPQKNQDTRGNAITQTWGAAVEADAIGQQVANEWSELATCTYQRNIINKQTAKASLAFYLYISKKYKYK